MRTVEAASVSGQATGGRLPSPAGVANWFRDFAIIPIIVVMVVVLAFIAPNFMSTRNFLNILDQNAPLMLIALGTTFVIIAGAFDLSAGQIMSLTGVFAAQMALTLENPGLGLLCGLLLAVPIGIINGWLVGKLNINSFLATLATGLAMGGLALLTTQGLSIDLSSSNNFRWLGSHRIGQVPFTVVVIAAVFLVLTILLSKTVYGRRLYSVGSNEEAARLSGISTARIRVWAYVVGASCAAIGGLIFVSRTGVGNVYAGANSITLNAIAAVVIGGTSILGGRGAMWRTFLGVMLLALMQNAFNLLSIQPYWQQIVSGLIIIFAVILNSSSSDRR